MYLCVCVCVRERETERVQLEEACRSDLASLPRPLNFLKGLLMFLKGEGLFFPSPSCF